MSLASAEETVARLLTEQNGLPKAINIYRETIPLMLEGLMYFHRYERFILGCFVAFGFFCWIIYVIVLLTFPRSAKFSRSGPETMTLAVSLVEIIAMLAHGWHWPGYVYVLMPNFLLDLSYKSTKRFGGGVLMKSVSPLVLSSVATIFLTEFIIATFFERKYLTVAVLGGAIWCLVSSRGSSNRLRQFYSIFEAILFL